MRSRVLNAMAIAVLAVVALVPQATEASSWHSGYFTWYSPGEAEMSSHTACGQRFDKYLIGVAAPLGQGWKCGDRVTLKVGSRVRHTKVVDFCGGCVRYHVTFDMTARLAIKLTGHPPHSTYGRWRYG
jgi:hypothetical protein